MKEECGSLSSFYAGGGTENAIEIEFPKYSLDCGVEALQINNV